MKIEPVRFRASLPPCDGAIKVHGDGGMRIMLDIAESNVPRALFIMPLRGKVLDVEIGIAKQSEAIPHALEKRPKR